ncbi:MAG: SDR family oxidoreductase [Actinomycetota bacterium]|nr:SDR family oxidoreductase [Actinomycetota bacterium]
MATLTNKVALVTGGSRGLGAATARALADDGADVAITYVASKEKAAAVVEELTALGVRAAAFRSDQADPAAAPELITDVTAHFGGLDILVNNAAIGVNAGIPVDSPNADVAEWDRMHATNYAGVIAITRAAVKVLREGGRIITVSSGLGARTGVPGTADYAATKAGITAYTRGIARDLAPRGITANVIQAGLMATDMTPDPEVLAALTANLAIQRQGLPAEQAEGIRFLATPAASYITGAVLDTNGGYLA